MAYITQFHSPWGEEVQEETQAMDVLTSETMTALTSNFPCH